MVLHHYEQQSRGSVRRVRYEKRGVDEWWWWWCERSNPGVEYTQRLQRGARDGAESGTRRRMERESEIRDNRGSDEGNFCPTVAERIEGAS